MEENYNLSKTVIFLIKLSYYDKKKISNLTDIEKYLGYDVPRKDIRYILNTLIKEDILVFIDKIYGIKRYKLNIKKLDEFITKTPAYKLFYDYFNTKSILITD